MNTLSFYINIKHSFNHSINHQSTIIQSNMVTVTLSDSQERAMTLALEGKSLVVSGRAGSGKTFWINEFCKRKGPHVRVAKTATTGVASLNIGGMTIHRFSGVGAADPGHKASQILRLIRETKANGTGLDIRKLEQDFIREAAANLARRVRRYGKTCRKITEARIIILDECSMLSRYMYEVLSAVFCDIRQCMDPWGGMQVILVGDVFQMEPVAPDAPDQSDMMADYFFSSELFDRMFKDSDTYRVFFFEKIFRQSDITFQNLLNRVAHGTLTAEDTALLQSRVVGPDDIPQNATRLFGLNSDVEQFNATRLKALVDGCGAVVRTFEMCSSVVERLGGSEAEITSAKDWVMQNCIADQRLELCEGAYVMLLRNLDTDLGLANGTCGYVVGFDPDGHPLFVRDQDYDEWQMLNTKSNDDRDESSESFEPPAKRLKIEWNTTNAPNAPKSTTSVRTLMQLTEKPNDLVPRGIESEPRWKAAYTTSKVLTVGVGSWESTDYNVARVAANQIPLKLAWAITMHKAQGQTLTRTALSIDKRNCRSRGQAYVGLSRQTDISGLYLRSFDPSAIRVSQKVLDFYEKIKV